MSLLASIPAPFPPAACPQLEQEGYLYAATTEDLAQVVACMDLTRLVPYDKGDPAGIVRHIDGIMGLRPKPL